jgi:hypothetical protein
MSGKKKTPKDQGAKPPEASTLHETTTHTWASLLRAVPAPTKQESELYALRTSPAELIERGSHIRSEKIRTDLVRLYGITAEFLPKATAAQRKLLLGFSDAFFRVAVHAGAHLGALIERRTATAGVREQAIASGASTAAQSYTEGMAERDRLVTALEGLVDYDATLETRLDAARGRVTDATTLAASLLALVKLIRELLKQKTTVVAQQLHEGGVTAEELKGSEAIAAKVKESDAQASGARAQGEVSQADLDLQDGICLTYLERLMRTFNRAHEQDPSIPQLLPIATRRMFAASRKKAAAVAAAEKGGKGEGKDPGASGSEGKGDAKPG